MWAHGSVGFPFFLFFPFGTLLLIVAGGLWFRASTLRHWRVAGRGPWGGFDSAHAVLRERYARGEIDAEEYRARQEELKH